MKRIIRLAERQLRQCENISEVSLPNERDEKWNVGDQVGPDVTDFNSVSDENTPTTTDKTGKSLCKPGWATSVMGNRYSYKGRRNFGL